MLLDEIDKTSIGEQLKYWRMRNRLSQLELALECDTSTRHLSFVETGRAQPSRQLLLRLTESLQVPLRARNTMLLSAGYAPLFEETGLTEPEMEQIGRMLRIILEKNEPFPSILIDRHWDIIDCNQAFRRMCEIFAHDTALLSRQPLNLLRLFLNPECMGRSVVNFHDMYATMLNRARRFVNLLGADEISLAILEEITRYKPADIPEMTEDLPRLIMPLHLRKGDQQLNLFTMVASMGGPLNITLQELQLEFALPIDDGSDRFLHHMLEN